MRIAILHYHCRPGGVTRVIASAVGALRERGVETLVLTGEDPPEDGADLGPCRVIEWLGYGAGRQAPSNPAADLIEAAKDGLGAEPDVWHFHNHSLGKNVSVPLAVSALASAGKRMLLQIHDFAEDGRPDNYAFLLRSLSPGDPEGLGRALYPAGGGVHYAVLNRRDLDFLRAAGVEAERLHELPNPVVLDEFEEIPRVGTQEEIYLYVTRAIRRKNLGEFLLWAAVAKPGARFQVTRAPKNPEQRPVYNRWVEFARSAKLPVEFEVGERSDLPLWEMISRARCAVTTSVAEGFGLAFLEPWLAGRAVTGRNLDEVTRGFGAKGVDLSMLYHRIELPVEWVGADRVRSRLAQAMRESLRSYGRDVTEGMIDRALADMARGERIDFGRLDETLQEDVIRRVAGSAEARTELSPGGLEVERVSDKVIAANRGSVIESFGPAAYGERLEGIYRRALESGGATGAPLSGAALLDRFLAPERFCLLRT